MRFVEDTTMRDKLKVAAGIIEELKELIKLKNIPKKKIVPMVDNIDNIIHQVEIELSLNE